LSVLSIFPTIQGKIEIEVNILLGLLGIKGKHKYLLYKVGKTDKTDKTDPKNRA